MGREDRADLHELEALLQLLHQDVDLDGAGPQVQVVLQGQEEGVPPGGLGGGLDLGQVVHQAAARGAQGRRIVHREGGQVGDGGGEGGAAGLADVAVVQVQAPGAVEHGGEVQLLSPVLDDRVAEEALGPAVHLVRDPFGHVQEEGVPRQGQLEVAVVVQAHGLHLPQGVLPVEHPPVGAGKEGVRHVADAGAGIGVRLRGRARALDPLPAQVGGDLRPVEAAGPGFGHGDGGAGDGGGGVQEADGLPPLGPRLPARGALGHEIPAARVQGRQGLQGALDLGGQDIGVLRKDAFAVFEDHGEPPSVNQFGPGSPSDPAK